MADNSKVQAAKDLQNFANMFKGILSLKDDLLQIADAEKYIADLSNQRISLERQRDDLTVAMKALQEGAVKLRADMQAAIDKTNQEINDRQVKAEEDAAKVKKQAAEAADLLVQSAQNALNDLQGQIEVKRKELKTTEDDFQNAQGRLTDMRRKLAEVRDQIVSMG